MNIIELCIYKYIVGNTEYCYITYPGENKLYPNQVCYNNIIPKNNFFKEWRLYGTMAVFSPDVSPILDGSSMFLIQNNDQFPYNTKSITRVYDFFDRSRKGIYFITYSQPVQNTLPLYINIKNKYSISVNLELTEEIKNNYNNINLYDDVERKNFSPVFYILSFNFYPTENIEDKIKFECYNNICVPSKNTDISLRECNNLCYIPKAKKPKNILQLITRNKK